MKLYYSKVVEFNPLFDIKMGVSLLKLDHVESGETLECMLLWVDLHNKLKVLIIVK